MIQKRFNIIDYGEQLYWYTDYWSMYKVHCADMTAYFKLIKNPTVQISI